MTAPLPDNIWWTTRGIPPSHPSVRGTMWRLRALTAIGHSPERIAAALGRRVTARQIRQIRNGSATTVSLALRRRIAWLYEAWWDKVPPTCTPAERHAQAVALGLAKKMRWCTGAGLDDDELDQPGFVPKAGWQPATGTGLAGDRPLVGVPR